MNPHFVGQRRGREAGQAELHTGGQFLRGLRLTGFFRETVTHESWRLFHQFVTNELRGGARLGMRQRIELLDRLRPHARGLHEAEVGARGQRNEVAGAVERIVFSDASDDGGLGVGWHTHAMGLGDAERIKTGILGVISREGFRHERLPARREVVGNANLGGRREIGRIHRDVAGGRLLPVGHLGDFKNFVGQPH